MSSVLASSVEDGNRFGKLALSHVAGAALGGVALGVLVLGLHVIAGAVPSVRDVLAFAGTLAVGAALLGRYDQVWPQRHAQVPAHWMNAYSMTRTFFGWGWILGLGLLTNAITPMYSALLLGLAVQPHWQIVLPAGVLYGLGRGSSILWATWRFKRSAPGTIAVGLSARRYLLVPAAVCATGVLLLSVTS